MDTTEPTAGSEPARPAAPTADAVGWGSDAVAWALRALPLDYIALNPGASYRGLHDSLVNLLGNQAPEMLVCLHEEHAVALAHGYAKVTEQPMAVAVHSNVGLMHASMAVYNAWCDRAPILILGATGPVDANRRRAWIDWIHTSQDQAGLVRNFVKWDNQPGSAPAAVEAVLRGWQVASRRPQGPVYVCLDVQMQEQRLDEPLQLPDPTRFRPGHPPEPPGESLDRAADLLRGAERPVLLMGRVSRDPQDWARRVALVERLGAIALSDLKVAAAFPTEHPQHPFPPAFRMSRDEIDLLRAADVILSLDWLDLGGTLYTAWPDGRPTATVIHASLDDYVMNGWAMNHQRMPPVDLPLEGLPDAAVAALLDRLPERKTTPSPVRSAPPPEGADSGRFDLRALAATLQQVLGERLVSYLRLPLGWPGASCRFRHPLDHLGYDGGAGVGSGPGMAVGSALALRGSGRLPVAVLGDGDLMMGANALWTAARHGIPLLIVVANNRAYFNDVAHQETMAKERGRPVENKWVGQRLDEPAIDIAAIARAQGFEAEGPIDNAEDLAAALRRAVAAVEAGRPALLDVTVAAGYAGGVVDFGASGHRRWHLVPP